MSTLGAEVQKVDAAITRFLDSRARAVEDSFVRHYHDTIRQYIMAGGKRMRPFLVIQAYKGLTGDNNHENIYQPSISVEFLHNASLIHDDIIDRDDTRRGQPAFHALFKRFYQEHDYKFADASHFGTTMGILGGDSVFFLGMEALMCNFPPALTKEAMVLYVQAYHDICDGVLMEMNFVQIEDVTEAQYLKMVSLKTGALIERSLLIGAAFARASESARNILSTYATNLGIAFQIKDDILGSFGDEQKTGKSSDGDIKDGKKTLLLLKALEKAQTSDRAFLASTVGKEGISKPEIDRVRSIFSTSGAVAYCEEKIKQSTGSALQAIDALDGIMKDNQRKALKGLVDFNLKREK
nr:polyprenyl synthetase family protein [Candidatus Sigynarchaeota archaeon]